MLKKTIIGTIAAIAMMAGLHTPASAAMNLAKPAAAETETSDVVNVGFRGRRGFRGGGFRGRRFGGFRRRGFRHRGFRRYGRFRHRGYRFRRFRHRGFRHYRGRWHRGWRYRKYYTYRRYH